MIHSSVADPNPGYTGPGAFLTPGSRIRDGKKKSGSGISIPDHFSESLETVFWVKFFDADRNLFDPGSGIGHGKNSDLGSGIRDKHPGSATLITQNGCAALNIYLFIQYRFVGQNR